MDLSWGESTHRLERFRPSFKTEHILDLDCQPLSVFGEVCVPLYTLTTGQFDDLEAVVASIAATHAVQQATKSTVLKALTTIFAGLACVATLAVDAKRSAEGPAASFAVQIGKSAGFHGVPVVDTVGGVVCGL